LTQPTTKLIAQLKASFLPRRRVYPHAPPIKRPDPRWARPGCSHPLTDASPIFYFTARNDTNEPAPVADTAALAPLPDIGPVRLMAPVLVTFDPAELVDDCVISPIVGVITAPALMLLTDTEAAAPVELIEAELPVPPNEPALIVPELVIALAVLFEVWPMIPALNVPSPLLMLATENEAMEPVALMPAELPLPSRLPALIVLAPFVTALPVLVADCVTVPTCESNPPLSVLMPEKPAEATAPEAQIETDAPWPCRLPPPVETVPALLVTAPAVLVDV
jgi:hypothetical protein